MRYGVALLTFLGGMFTVALHAQEGVPSAGKLSRLGLGSMQVAPDAAGEEVRGRFYISWDITIQSEAGGNIDGPYVFSDMSGTPNSYDPPVPPVTPLPFVISGSASASDTVGDETTTSSTSTTFTLTNTPTFTGSFPTFSFSFP